MQKYKIYLSQYQTVIVEAPNLVDAYKAAESKWDNNSKASIYVEDWETIPEADTKEETKE